MSWFMMSCPLALLASLLFAFNYTLTSSTDVIGYGGWDIGRLSGDLSNFSNCGDFSNGETMNVNMKGLIGLSFLEYPSAPELLPSLPYHIVNGRRKKPSTFKFNCSEKELEVVDALAHVLAKENDEFAHFFDAVPRSHTFRLPASWGSPQEDLLRVAAARVNVSADIQRRPSGASMRYAAVHAQFLQNSCSYGERRPHRVLVYSFDDCVTVDRVTVYEDRFVVEAKQLPCYLTPESIHEHARSYFLDMFAKLHQVNLSTFFGAMRDFQHQLERGFHAFLFERNANLTIDLSAPGWGSRHEGPKFKVVASTSDFDAVLGFEELSRKLLAMTEKAMDHSKWKSTDVDMVVTNGLGAAPKIQQILKQRFQSSQLVSLRKKSGFDAGDLLESVYEVASQYGVINTDNVVINTYEDEEKELRLCKVKNSVAYQDEIEELRHELEKRRHEAETGFASQELEDLIWEKRGARKGNLTRYSSCWKLVQPLDAYSSWEAEVWVLVQGHGSVSCEKLDSEADDFCLLYIVWRVMSVCALSGTLVMAALMYFFCGFQHLPTSLAQDLQDSMRIPDDESLPAQEIEVLLPARGWDGNLASDGDAAEHPQAQRMAAVEQAVLSEEMRSPTSGSEREITTEAQAAQHLQGHRRRNQRTRQRYNAAMQRARSPEIDYFD